MHISSFIDYISKNWVELLATIFSLIYVFFSVKEKRISWFFGFLCSALYIVVFFQSKFYADMSLQFYYLAVSVFGWITWKNIKNENIAQTLHISTLNKSQFFQYFISSVAIYVVYYLILKFLTDSTIPIMDSIVGALSVIATWMLAKKKIENWLLWIVADALALGLFIYKELYPTAVLFVFYTVMAAIGYFEWRKSLRS